MILTTIQRKSRVLTQCILLLGVFLSMASTAASVPQIVIIIDDLGYKASDFDALTLPSEVVFSILPDTPHSRPLANAAHQQGRDVMLHLPMEAEANNRLLGPRAIMANHYADKIALTFEAALNSVPGAIGVNNHMGSLLTEDTHAMTELMRVVRKHDLFFVDSRTSPHSVAYEVAKKLGVASAKRHVFLDHELSEHHLRRQFRRLVLTAYQQGIAIGIAHPHAITLDFLDSVLRDVSRYGVALKPVSEHLNIRAPGFRPNPKVSASDVAPQ